MKDVRPNEELTYCYGLFCNSDWKNPEDVCYCGSEQCFGKILPWCDLPKEFKIKYLDYTADWILFDEMKEKGMIQELQKLI